MPIKFLLLPILFLSFSKNIFARDSTDLMNQLISEGEKNKIDYAENTFIYTRTEDWHSVKNLPEKVMDVRICQRFTVMRLGFDYVLSNNFMIGVDHSVYQKLIDQKKCLTR